ncbi:MAG: hypothetical protein AABY40_00290 [Nanoarchaeota archaeon]
MLIIHEELPREAARVNKALNQVYGLKSTLINQDLSSVFVLLKKFNGFKTSERKLSRFLAKKYDSKKCLVVTSKDIYTDTKNKNDDWIFGYQYDKVMVVSTARLKGGVSQEHYLRRVEFIAAHEAGHEVIEADHYKNAAWVNSVTGYKLPLGYHCTDNKCVMYGIVDLQAPPSTQGYLKIGRERRNDAGLDDVLERMHPHFLCNKCSDSMKTDSV